MTWEMVAGDFGDSYKATVEGRDLSDCTAKLTVWVGSTILIDGKACGDVTYASSDSYCYYAMADGDIPADTAEDDIVTCRCMVEFTKDGTKIHDLGFNLVVHPPPPS